MTDPEHLRTEFEALLAAVPEPDAPGTDIEELATKLEEAHDVLAQALRSVERNPAATSAPGAEIEG
jgi:hypothetical protein